MPPLKSQKTSPPAPCVDVTITLRSSPERVIRAFFDPLAISAWWQASRSITIPRVLGPYVVQWPATDFRDDILGRLGGVISGTIIEVDPARGFFVANAYWLSPDGDPIGPMALEVTCAEAATTEPSGVPHSTLRVLQSGYEEGVRWRRYYEVVGAGWERALGTLKNLIEQ
jgi:uncharacterized protein YndB with AHSA1/START domain